MSSKTCQICGKPSGMYPLCKDCFKLKDQGEIEKCEICGTWHYVDEQCECEYEEDEEFDAEYLENLCLICGEDSGEHLLCKKCYYKYKNKTLLLKLKVDNDMKIDVLDESWEGIYVCDDGHIVKSMAERDIDNWLFEQNIKHIYEPEYIALDSMDKKIHPDWCLPNYIKDENEQDVDVYIEYWGLEGDDRYERIKHYKLPIYKSDNLTLVCINGHEDIKNIKATLEQKIKRKKNIKPYTINWMKK